MKFKNFIYRTLSVVGLACLSATVSSGQVTVTATGGTLSATYPTIADAVTQINAGTHTGTIAVAVNAGHTETAPTGGIALTATGTVGNPITIQKSGAGANPVITAYTGGTGTPGTAVQDGVFRLVGSDYVTIDGIDIAENAANTTNPATMEYGYALYKASATDGCQNNTIRNCVITLNRVNNATGTTPVFEGATGIFVTNSLATTATTPLTITAATGSNSFNRFYSNTIQNCNIGIGLAGFTAPSPFTLGDTGNDIGGSSAATGNTILNFGGAAAATNPAAGIRTLNQWSLNISYNTVNNNNGAGVNHSNTLRGIFVGLAVSANATINNNMVSMQGGGTTNLLEGIDNASGNTAAGNTISINNNMVTLRYNTATTANINGILNSGTAANLSLASNTVTAPSGLSSTGTLLMIETGSPTSATVTQNSIINIVGTGASGTIRGIKTTSPTTLICTNNLVENVSYTNLTSTGNIDGFYGLSSSVNVTINGNIIRNLSTPTTGTITGIREFGVTGTKIVQSNQVYNFSTTAGGVGGASFDGIFLSTGSITIASNQVYALNSTGTTGGTAGAINGIRISGGTVSNVFKNKVTDLSSNSTGVVLSGLLFSGNTTNNAYNNIIGDLRTPAANAANPLIGINVNTTTTVNLYHNTIYLAGTSAGVNFGSSAVSANTGGNLTMNSNIFVNTSTANGTGLAVAYRRSSTTLTSYQAASNRNAFFASTIYTDGTNTDAIFAAFQARMATRDGLSINENPPFVSLVSTNGTYLHINTTIATGVESGGTAIAGITDDFDGDVRFGNVGYSGTGFAPDMGADEFNGISTAAACAGAPAASDAQASVTTACPSTVINLSLSTNYITTGITYQWQSSADGVTYSNILGATAATATATQTAATFYRAIVSCSNSGQSITATPVSVVQSGLFFCYCAPTYTSGGGGGDGIANVSLNTLNNTSGAAPSPYYTFFNTVTIPSITQNATETISITFGTFGSTFGGVWIDYNQDGDFNDAGEFVANTTVGSTASGTVALTFTVPLAALTGQTVMRVRSAYNSQLTNTPCGAASSGFGEAEDYIVNIVATTACAGAPAASNAVSSVTSTCPSTVFNLSLSTSYSATGITYQWQSSPDGVTYSNISGATAATTTATQTAATFYRAIVTCANSGQSITATPVSVVQSSLFFCYCAPTYAQGAGQGDEITNVRLNTLNNTSGASASPYYTFFNTVTVPSITQNATETISVTFGNSGNDYAGVWIDYNQDGDFNDAGEFVANTTVGSTASGTAALTFTVPLAALTGQTMMRVRSAFGSQLTNTPCGATVSSYGEAEDYIVNIVATTACAGAPAAANSVASVTSTCPSVAFNLSLSTAYTASGITYQWQSSADGVTYSNISGATAATTTATQTAATFYRAIVTCANSGQSVTATPVSVTQSGLFFCYCASTYTSGAGTTDGITNVRLNTLNNTSTQNNVSPYYTFFNTVTVPSITQNATETISVTFGSDGNQFTGVWIDYNQDGDFNDAGEFVANSTVNAGSLGTAVLTLTVPSGATTGQTLMRVRGGNDTQLTNTPCGASSSAFGETEDYIVNIVAAPVCAVTATISSQTNVACFAGATGAATVAANGGTAPYSFAWSNGRTTATNTGLTAGTYTVTATDVAACTATTTVTITQPASALTANASTTTNVACFAGATGAANVAANGGTAPYSFAWSNGRTTATNTGLVAGTYMVTVADANGCMAMSSATISQPTAITLSTASSQASCGAANGSATATATGGTMPYSYLWTGGRTGANITGLTAGAYSLTLTDNAGCTVFSSTTVSQPSSVSVSATSTNVSCNGAATGTATATANGGSAPYTFAWTGGRTTANITGLTAGVYSLTLTDNVGCSAFAAVTITQPTALAANISSQTNVACFGGATGAATVAANGGTAPYSFAWTGGATTATNTGLAAGTYMVTVADANGCMAMSAATITQPASALAANISSQTNIACFGGATGAATVAANGGTAPYSFVWTGGATTATNTGLAAGTYMVTVADANGCMAMSAATITQPASALAANASTTTNVACFGDSNGEAMAMATGGTAPYSFAWINGRTTANNTGLAAGVYSVTATDANNCMSMATVTITAPTSALSLNIAVDNNVSCNGLADGAITANASGGTTPYSFAWSNSQTNAIATGLAAGTYTATVTDANNCIVVGQATTITMPSALSISIASTDPTSCGVANGSATATVSGGTTAYNFAWNNGGNTAAINGLSAGNYMVTATDANGCMVMAAATLSAPNGITVSFPAFTNVSCFGADDATINADVVGGTAPFAFAWNNNATTQNVSGLAAGTYFVTATDANGCSNSGSLAVGAPAQLTVAATATDASCLTCADGTAAASSTGGTGAVSFLWSNGASTATISGLLPDTYTVSVTDANGCNTTTNVVVSVFVAVTEQTANAIRLYPNPTSSFVTIDGLNTGARLSVVNALGQVIRTVETQNNVEQIDLSDLAPAVYLIRIESGRQQTTLRVTVAK